MEFLNLQCFSLKPELFRSLMECGFEELSQVQRRVIPAALLGIDLLYQAKCGTGKTSAYVIATLQQLKPIDGQISILVLCLKRELAHGIACEYQRFCKYMPDVKVSAIYGGVPIKSHEELLRTNCPQIVIGTPGRILALVNGKALTLANMKHFILDSSDQLLETPDFREDINKIFLVTPQEKQVLMCSGINPASRSTCKKFMRDPLEIYIDHHLTSSPRECDQYYIQVNDNDKNQVLIDLLHKFESDPIVILVQSASHCTSLYGFLIREKFSAVQIHSGMPIEERATSNQQFHDVQKRILITTHLFGGAINMKPATIILNYDIPKYFDTYLHQVMIPEDLCTPPGRLVVTFVSDENDKTMLNELQKRFSVHIKEMPMDFHSIGQLFS